MRRLVFGKVMYGIFELGVGKMGSREDRKTESPEVHAAALSTFHFQLSTNSKRLTVFPAKTKH